VTDLHVSSTSVANDNGYLALADVIEVIGDLDGAWRLIGGQMVTLHVLHHQVDVAARETADTDLGAERVLASDSRLPAGMAALGYTLVGGNTFVRGQAPGQRSIDVLAPIRYGVNGRSNAPAGNLSVDESPGLRLGLQRPPDRVHVTVRLTTADELSLTVDLPDLLSAIVLKLGAYRTRLAPRDIEDLWRLLECAHAAGLTVADWPDDEEADAALATARTFLSRPTQPAWRVLPRPARTRAVALLIATLPNVRQT